MLSALALLPLTASLLVSGATASHAAADVTGVVVWNDGTPVKPKMSIQRADGAKYVVSDIRIGSTSSSGSSGSSGSVVLAADGTFVLKGAAGKKIELSLDCIDGTSGNCRVMNRTVFYAGPTAPASTNPSAAVAFTPSAATPITITLPYAPPTFSGTPVAAWGKTKGKAKVGAKVSVSAPTLLTTAKIKYAWFAGNKKVGKKSALKITSAMRGKKLKVSVLVEPKAGDSAWKNFSFGKVKR